MVVVVAVVVAAIVVVIVLAIRNSRLEVIHRLAPEVLRVHAMCSNVYAFPAEQVGLQQVIPGRPLVYSYLGIK